MSQNRLLPFIGLFVFVGLWVGAGSAEAWFRSGAERTIKLELANGAVEVQLVPDRGKALALVQDGKNRWVFDGSTEALVGGSYSIVLRNRTAERLKIVVGVDGVNIYRRDPIVGRADGDTGSILAPWGTRTLPGWQLDHERAQRFVFSPPEWSEGQGRTDSQIGLIVVQVYRERQPRWFGCQDKAGIRAPESGKKLEAESRSQAQPQIGTTSGDDVTSRVRTVMFESRTSYPEVWAEIDYGRHIPPPRPRRRELLGIEVESTYGGSRILSVEPGSPADRAGLECHDVIVRIDTSDEPSPATLKRILRAKSAGDHVFIRVRRGPHELALKIRV
ncbi:MAG: PDZ domain-containing protein [Thermoanaerobaculales bacterium]|nr:PDZ domain-containing protein [Thermoanaerobaculales bacterium]